MENQEFILWIAICLVTSCLVTSIIIVAICKITTIIVTMFESGNHEYHNCTFHFKQIDDSKADDPTG